jgi:hypothetical protein
MEVIRGTTRSKRRRRWWAPRPVLRLAGDARHPQVPRNDPFFLAMIASFCLFVLVFAMFMGGWTGG